MASEKLHLVFGMMRFKHSRDTNTIIQALGIYCCILCQITLAWVKHSTDFRHLTKTKQQLKKQTNIDLRGGNRKFKNDT